MSMPSRWPLSADGVRFLIPQRIIKQLRQNPLSKGLYITAMGYYPKARGHVMIRERHPDHILIYCVEGGGKLTLDDKTLSIGSGDFIYLPRGSSHHYQANKRQPWSIYWLHFDGELADEFYNYIQLPEYHLNIGVQPRVIRVFDGVAALRHSRNNLGEFVQGGHQVQALLSYIALLSEQRRIQSGASLDLEKIRAIMQENIHGQLDLDTLANEAKLSKYYFSKKFKELTGEPPIRYFINMKMQRACYLLDSNSRPVKQIAEELGYDDNFYFSRLFKKSIGMSPEHYRQAKQ